MKTLIRIFKIIIGILLLPLLYARYSGVIFLLIGIFTPLLFEHLFMAWIFYSAWFVIFMGSARLMKYWAGLWVWIFRIKYSDEWDETPDVMHSASVWSHSILTVDGREYKVSIATMGGKTYDEDDHFARKAVIYSLIRW